MNLEIKDGEIDRWDRDRNVRGLESNRDWDEHRRYELRESEEMRDGKRVIEWEAEKLSKRRFEKIRGGRPPNIFHHYFGESPRHIT